MKKALRMFVRWGLAAVFLYAALPKIVYPADFAKAVYYYHLLPDGLINLTALFLPWLELLCACALLVAPRWRRAAYLLAAGMLAVFTIGIFINVLRGVDINCGCFSVHDTGGEKIGWRKIAENLVLLAASVYGLTADGSTPAPPPGPPSASSLR